MKRDTNNAYWRIFLLLSYQIITESIKPGEKVLSHAEISKRYHVSGQTARTVLKLLKDCGLIETSHGSVSRSALNPDDWYCYAGYEYASYRIDYLIDILHTMDILFPPFALLAARKCDKGTITELEDIIENMTAYMDAPVRFWRLTRRFWHTLEAQAGNAFYMQVRFSLGLFDFPPPVRQRRDEYTEWIDSVLKKIRCGDIKALHGLANPKNFDEFIEDAYPPLGNFKVPVSSPLVKGVEEIIWRLRDGETQNKSIFLDIISELAMHGCKPGDQLPSHKELAATYGVTHNTTVPVVQRLQKMGVVESIRGRGIFVCMTTEQIRSLHLEPEEVALRLKRGMDQLQFLALTIKPVILYGLKKVTADELSALTVKMYQPGNDLGALLYEAGILQNFINNHIRYTALKAIYSIIHEEVGPRFGLPGIMQYAPETVSDLRKQCAIAATLMKKNNMEAAAEKMHQFYSRCYSILEDLSKKAGYWEAAQKVPITLS